MLFQKVGQTRLDRKDHIWFKIPGRVGYKCCLCGGLARTPPGYPTPEGWLPDSYEELTPAERAQSPRDPRTELL